MTLQFIDWFFIAVFFAISLIIGALVARKAGSSASDFFLSGRSMPWWLLGVSMVATTFSTDTPNLVTDIVRQNGLAGNWVWISFVLTGMLTVFVYARLWRRTGILTDVEFYELRYSGKPAAFLRAFRAIYLGIFFNVAIMANVSLAAIKIGGVLLGYSPLKSILLASAVTLIFSTMGGLRGVLLTDFLLFIVAMAGSIAAAFFALKNPQIGGLENLFANPAIAGKLSLLPDFSNKELALSVFIIPLAVQWWSVWYPGSEPGGGGYVVQRMLAAKNEKHALAATLFFNVAHYALRPWPWFIVALASLIVFPDLASLQTAFPNITPDKIGHDLAYPAMLTFLPTGVLGLVLASLIAAYMSTISTHLNWGSSYIVNDFYRRFINPAASEKALVRVGRLSTVILMVLSSILALALQNALQAFHIMLQIGAGTGLLFILRWFWWRINAYSEITAMIVSFFVAVYMQFFAPETLPGWARLSIGVLITTIAWIAVTFLTKPTDTRTLIDFIKLVNPGGPGWKKITSQMTLESPSKKWTVPMGILCMLIASIGVWSAVFATGYWLYAQYPLAIFMSAVTLTAAALIFLIWRKIEL